MSDPSSSSPIDSLRAASGLTWRGRCAIVVALTIITAAVLFYAPLRNRVIRPLIGHVPSEALLLQRPRGIDAAPLRGDAPTTDWAALRKAAFYLRHATTYYIRVGATADTAATTSDLRAAGYLLFLPAVPVADPQAAAWILSYKAGPLPPSIVPTVTYELGGGIYLSKVTA